MAPSLHRMVPMPQRHRNTRAAEALPAHLELPRHRQVSANPSSPTAKEIS
jgi:hypothetical protein